MFLITDDTTKFVVVQSNELVEATYSPELTTRAHKVARFILSLISPEDHDLKLYKVPINTIKEFLGYKETATWGSFYPEIKDIADRLNKEPIVIKKDDKLTTAFFIAGYEIDAAQRTVTFELSLLLKPYLLALKKNFTTYPLNYIAQLRSAYSIRLYELLCQYKNIGRRTIDLKTLQALVGSNYDYYGNFKDKVLTIAKRDLANNTDIDFNFTEIKLGRKVVGIRFIIISKKTISKAKEKPAILLSSKGEEIETYSQSSSLTAQMVKNLLALGLKSSTIDKYKQLGFDIITHEKQREEATRRCNNSLETYFIEKLAICQQSKKAPKNRVGFLVKALQEDWQDAKNTSVKMVAEQQNLIPFNTPVDTKQQEARKRELKKQLVPIKQAIFEDIIASDTEGFLEIFETIKENSGSMKNMIFPPDISPMEVFRSNGMAANLLKIRIEEMYLDRFVEFNRRLKELNG